MCSFIKSPLYKVVQIESRFEPTPGVLVNFEYEEMRGHKSTLHSSGLRVFIHHYRVVFKVRGN